MWICQYIGRNMRGSSEGSAAEKNQMWEDVHRKFGTQKKKSVKYEK